MGIICYCFNYTEEEIRKDVRSNSGKSTIVNRILEEKKRGNCDCFDKHPERR